MKVGIVGLPFVGKSTLFQLLTGVTPVPGKVEPRSGIAQVPDTRLERLSEMFRPRRTTPATIEYVDLPGVSRGQGSSLVDLPALRGVDALLHVVRAFESETVPHPEGSVDPLRDAELVEIELILADLSVVERRLERLASQIQKTRRVEDLAEQELLLRIQQGLEEQRPLRELDLAEAERQRLQSYALLSEKPMVLAVNLGENQVRAAQDAMKASGLLDFTRRPGLSLCPVSAPIEAEMAELPREDARAFGEEMGLAEPGLDRLIQSSYSLLGLISFLTVGEDECRAWTIRRGTSARRAASAVHSDIERGFIRAENVAYDDLISAGSLAACRDRGLLRLEGQQYEVQDGDVINFRFNV